MAAQKIAYYPDRVPHPGLTLLDILEEKGMTEKELSLKSGIPEETILNIIKNRQKITCEIADALEESIGTSAEFWKERENKYKKYLADKSKYNKAKFKSSISFK